MESFKTKVSLGSTTVKKEKGKPFRQFLSFVYEDKTQRKGMKINVDLTSFRPDIEEHMKPDKKYEAKLTFRVETNEKGDNVYFLKKVILDGKIFVRTR